MSDQKKIPHESAVYHVTGEATYIDDILVNERLLHGHVVTSPHAHARILSFDLSAAKAVQGVYAVLCHSDIPGENQMGPAIRDEVVLPVNEVIFVGQAVFLIAAENESTALAAAKLIKIDYEPLPAILTIEDAIRANALLHPPRTIATGDSKTAMGECDNVIEGELHTGGQEHWYLETQVCLCLPGEGNEIQVFSSTQHPSETQALIAEVLHVPKMEVEVQVRRMGGAFGGKETQANHTAIWTALLCKATGRPVKIRLFRDDDQKMTGKRHRFFTKYKVGFGNDGRMHAVEMVLNADAGSSTDLTMAVLERAMMHADNSYFLPNATIVGKAWKLNLPSNTAFRGFGGPQGMAVIETIIDRIARQLRLDPDEVRVRNYYGLDQRNITPYGQVVENNRLHVIREQLLASSDYVRRREEIRRFNAGEDTDETKRHKIGASAGTSGQIQRRRNEFLKRGIAMTPVKFGISFTTSFLNQAGALVNVYKDGTVLVNHGGTEMGQGLHTKIKQIAALEFGVSLDMVKVNATHTGKVPNTSATAASAGTDLNGMAVKDAIGKLKARMVEVGASFFNKRISESESQTKDAAKKKHIAKTQPEDVLIADNEAFDAKRPERKMTFAELAAQCVFHQVSLSATGFYKTPDVHFDRLKGKGHPYFYFAFGMAVTEVQVDTLTGHVQLLRTDILHDVGESINPGIDIGQIEGGYVQGLGWVTTEECKWDDKGNLLNHSPDTYKIPNVQDIPADFRTTLLQGAPNPNTIRRSKAVAEPPLMLAFSAWLAIKDAISAVADHQYEPKFQIPATNEAILIAVEDLRQQLRAAQTAEISK